MSFNSLHFLLFFPAALFIYLAAPFRLRWLFLLISSLYFYAVWSPAFLCLLLGAVWVSYYSAVRIEDCSSASAKRRYLVAATALLLGNLFLFKYFNFFNESFRTVFHALNFSYGIPAIELILPLGISFYTFQLLSYVIDVYNGEMKAERRYEMLTLYLTFFPHLVAGPIVRASHLLPQMYKDFGFDYGRIRDGLQLMAWGFFKKVVVADRVAPSVEIAYGQPQLHDGVTMVVATLLFAVQVYCDFSGYSDIAIGAARTMGYDLQRNFNRPYNATSIADFWKRWHISLSTWLSDYVYTPLTRTKFLKLKWYDMMLVSLFLTFLASGLWHGAQWTFVLWGALHGTYVVASIVTQRWRIKWIKWLGLNRSPKLHRYLKIAVTFSLVCFSYIPFRAKSLGDVIHIVTHLPTGWGSFGTSAYAALFADRDAELLLILYGVLALFLVENLQRGEGEFGDWISASPGWLRWGFYYVLVGSVVMLGAFYGNSQQFIYFQF